MELPFDKCNLGMQELTEDSHRIVTVFPYLLDKGHQPSKIAILTPRVVLKEIQGDANDTHTKERLMDLEGLEEKWEVARRQSQRY